jgi:hypothetical protein
MLIVSITAHDPEPTSRNVLSQAFGLRSVPTETSYVEAETRLYQVVVSLGVMPPSTSALLMEANYGRKNGVAQPARVDQWLSGYASDLRSGRHERGGVHFPIRNEVSLG